MTDWAARVLDEVDAAAPAAVERLADLVRVPSVGGTDAEHEIQAMLASGLAADGFEVDHWRLPLAELMAEPDFPGVEVERSEAWGLVGRLPGTGDGASLMLNGHVDVVPTGDLRAWSRPDPFSGQVVDGELHGRGACDMKAGLVAAMTALTAVRRAGAPLRGDVLVACVPGEEDGGLGTYATLRRGWRADACVLPEPTGLHIVPANAGALTFRLTVPGRATHASRRTDGVSALSKALPVLAALERLEARRNAGVD
ncbi:MAG: M20/M25/M40 family metallo-hydrolase, partial [Actinomycetes bacterium]